MQEISKTATEIGRQAQTGSEIIARSSSNIPQRQSLGISREKITAMLAVLNKRWLSMGWRVMDPKDAEPMAIVWIEQLDREGIPHSAYHELYSRCVGLRSRRLEMGLSCDDFSVDMLIACWPGLRKEIKQREIDAGRTLTENAESVCKHCDGSGFKFKDGGVKRCDHSD
jgi:hypothetical protein